MRNLSRRRLLAVSAATGAGLLGSDEKPIQHGHAQPFKRDSATPVATPGASPVASPSATPVVAPKVNLVTPPIGEADAPQWRFILQDLEDGYQGKLIFPSEVPETMRIVRAEVILINASDQPLSFQSSSVHLLDAEGIEYPAGTAQGKEPRIVSQVLPGNSRARGSVWFIVPKTAELIEAKYFGPSPQFHVSLLGDWLSP